MSWFPPAHLVARFSDELLAADLPALPAQRRREATEFVTRRVADLPSPMRVGVSGVALAVGGASGLIGSRRLVSLLRKRPVPVAAEYVRLVRSLAYAYVWEHWPTTGPDGTER